VGENAHARTLSAEAFATVLARGRGDHAKASWGGASHPTASPDLWPELAALRGERGAREPGPWLEQSLERHLAASRTDLAQRLSAMGAALAASAAASA
jgi:hypothetical protein